MRRAKGFQLRAASFALLRAAYMISDFPSPARPPVVLV